MLKRTYGVLFTLSMNFDAEENTYKALHRMLGIHEYLNKDRGPTLLSLSEALLDIQAGVFAQSLTMKSASN